MIEVILNPENFLKVAETLTRMGIANNVEKKLYQSCHILQKKGKFYIAHFKELMQLDGKQVDFNEEDELRRTSIALTLQTWGLVDLVEACDVEAKQIYRIIKHSQKSEWTLIPKYKFK